MSIASEISRLQTAKADIKSAIESKGVTVPSSATIDTYDDYVSQISGGGGDVPSNLSEWTYDDNGNILSMTYTAETIPASAYSYSKLESATISNSVTTIEDSAFDYCTSLTSITIPSGVTSIGQRTFNNCRSFTSVTIPDSVISIGYRAFYNCFSLSACTIGNGVISISGQAFFNCSSLSSITVNAATPPELENANAFNNTNDCPIYVPAESLEAYKSATNWSTYASRIQAIPT